ncbi:MAG: hypothetical protein IPP90_04880 [Gemmatimonadaceae bacterium]|nr:hypothetical protein [Gemmatimonadaceae bacterium]
MTLLAALEWLAQTPWSIALHESQYMWPFTESLHVLTLTLFVGSAIVLDLRLLGVGFRDIPVTEFTGRLLPWTRGGFAVMVTTGVMLFYATPVTYYQSIFFRIKLILLVAAGINVFVFHTRTQRSVSAWDVNARPPRAARLAAVVSLVAWAGVVISGRLIAYNWFSCDIQPQSDFINWAASCMVGTPK